MSQTIVLRTLRSFAEKYGVAYPSIALLARCTGLTELQVVSTLKELVEGGRITKKARYDANGRKLSNEYIIIDPPADEKPLDNKNENEYPVKSFIKALKTAFIKKEEDIYTPREREPQISHESHLWLLQVMQKLALPHQLFLSLFRYSYIRETLATCHFWHIQTAVNELRFRLSVRHRIGNLGRWFNKLLENNRDSDIGGCTA